MFKKFESKNESFRERNAVQVELNNISSGKLTVIYFCCAKNMLDLF